MIRANTVCKDESSTASFGSDWINMADNEIQHSSGDAPAKAPFESIAFLYNDRAHGRILLRITKVEDGEESSALPEPSPFDGEFDFSAEGVSPSELLDEPAPLTGLHYVLHYEEGAAGRATEGDIDLTLEAAQKLQNSLVEAGVYLWDPEYGNDPNQPPAKWSFTAVLQQGVFTQSVRGGSDFPQGFSQMLEAFYEAGLPQPQKPAAHHAAPMGAGIPGNFGNMGSFDPSQMFSAMQAMMSTGMPQQALEEMQEIMNELKDNPEAFQERLKSEFRSLSPSQQDELLNLLSSTGMASRDWWEDFFRG